MDSEFRPFTILNLTLLFIVTIGCVGWALHAMGVWGNTVLEREVFENSYQYQEGRKAEIATFEAELAEIDAQLARQDLEVSTRSNLEASRAALRVRLNAAKKRAAH